MPSDMYRILRYFSMMCIVAAMPTGVLGQSIAPIAEYVNEKDEESRLEPGEQYGGSAPLTVRFSANPSDDEDWVSHYEWRFSMEGASEPYLIRYEQDTEYTFTQAGAHHIVCYAIFTRGNERVEYTQEFWSLDVQPIMITIWNSKLEMPNIFTPNNGDDYNNIYGAKPGYQSIVEFRAIIFNRWGTKLYEWNDPAGGWDGTYRGKDMPQGVYYVLVTAKGADGRKFTIRRDVNLIRNYSNESSSSSSSPE